MPSRLIVLFPLALALVAAGCGGGGNGASGVSAPAGGPIAAAPTSTTAHDDFVRYAACMKTNGIDAQVLPGARGGIKITNPAGGGGPSEAAIAKVDRKCRSLIRAEQSQPSNAADAKFRDQAYAFVRCLRRHGYNVPDPKIKKVAGGYDLTLGPPPGQTPAANDTRWAAAQSACQSFSPFNSG